MRKTEKKAVLIAGCIVAFIAVFVAVVSFTPIGRASWNMYASSLQKVDDSTRYQTRKEVEDTCRAMVSSYEADRLAYEQYTSSNSEEKQSWAEQAKMRANKTAATYNNYILENSFVWSGNVPADISVELPYLE